MNLDRYLVLCALAGGLIACGGSEKPEATPAPEVQLGTSMPHGDHSARYGGTVWMHGDLHFEVALAEDGQHHVYFSDASRVELPAAVASDVTVTILRAGEEPESLTLTIDEFGESWSAAGAAVEDPSARAMVRFVYEGEPYEIEVPFLAEADANATDPHSMH